MSNVIELFAARELTAEEIMEAFTAGELLRMSADVVDEMVAFERIAHLAYTDPHQALHELCDRPYREETSYLRSAIIALVHVNLRTGPRELDVRQKFYRNLSALIPGAVRIAKVCDRQHQPDGFIGWRGLEVPVEIKRRVFNAKALSQLQRYMKVYDSEMGIAVAPQLTCALPSNIHFVEVSITGPHCTAPAQSA